MKTKPLRKKKFARNKENFVCVECETPVVGDGYRNHCPSCLLSLHVDVNPGDRDADCRGVMDVVDLQLEHGKLYLTHNCRGCSFQRRNRTHPEDSIESITALMKKIHANAPVRPRRGR